MKFIYIATLLLLISLSRAAPTTDDNDSSSESSDDAPAKENSSTESKAGEAIKTLLQEKITQKFKEAANEVKGVLVKQLGDSLKSAHEAFNPPKEKELKKINAAPGAKQTESKASGAAKLHQNKANRHRKNSGPQQGTPNKPVVVPPKQGPPRPEGPSVNTMQLQQARPPPQGPPPPMPPPGPCGQPCGPPSHPDPCCTPQNTQYMVSQVQLPAPPPPLPMPVPPPGCMPGPCNQVCAPQCHLSQCCGHAKKSIVSHKKKKGGS